MTVTAEVILQEGPMGVSVTSDLRREFAQYLTNECGLAPGTAFTYEQGLKRLERYIGKDALEIGVGDVRHFLRTSPLASATKHSTLCSLKAFDRFLVLEGFRQPSNIWALRGPRITHKKKRPLTPDEARVVLDACSRPDEFKAVWLPLWEGLRVMEAARVFKREWELPWRLRIVGKGQQVREVPVHPELLAKRTMILESSATIQGLKNTARALSHVIGIPFSPHVLRHTFSATLRDLGARPEVRGALLGHAPMSITEAHYGEVTMQQMTDDLHKLRY